MKTAIISLLLFLGPVAIPSTILTLNAKPKTQNETVLICQSPDAYAYHAFRCRGLARCSYEVVRVSKAEAQNRNYRPCRNCYH